MVWLGPKVFVIPRSLGRNIELEQWKLAAELMVARRGISENPQDDDATTTAYCR